ncbi:MAG: ferrochelatase [Candidatus Solibacter usitatus]|nr:ferrochelatase [Candidatus Solibacter usitatus]
MPSSYDAILVLSFGGPEKREDVIPFLENVLKGRNVPRERMLSVAENYYRFGGASPINSQNRALIAALETELAARGPRLPVYWGNRNWHPLLADALASMKADGVRRALAFVTSAYSSYSACRQYLDDIAGARAAVGPGAPEVDKLRAFYDHPGFIGAMIERVQAALDQLPGAALLFTAHSIPIAMAQTSRYEQQLREACRLVAAGVGRAEWQLVYQSRSGPPSQPWLEPDIGDALRGLSGTRDVVVAPIGFVSDHMEVVYDLDTVARGICQQLGIHMVRAGTVGTHPAFISMIRELVLERVEHAPPRALGTLGLSPDACAMDCCPSGAGPRCSMPGHT